MATCGIKDFGFCSARQRAIFLACALECYGVAGVATRALVEDNEYQEVMPEAEHVYPDEFEIDQVPTTVAFKALLSPPMEGLLMDNPVISLTDKLETLYTLTTDVVLVLEDRVELTFPDGRKLHLRIVERPTTHSFTTIGNRFVGVVV